MGSSSKALPVRCVTRQDELDRLCEQVRQERRFAFDTEFVMEDCFEADVCLVQIATAGEIAIVDPFLDVNLAPVWSLVTDPEIEVVVHAGQEDLALCVQHSSQVPTHIFDVQMAAGLLGYTYPLSLQKLVQKLLHIRLHKAKTLTDWRKRPLTRSHISYGAEDVCYLLAIRDRIGKRLIQKRRVEWATEEFRRFENLSLYQREEEDKLARVKGSGVLKGCQLAIMRDLLTWRDTLAQRWNRPVRIVLKDHLLIEIARLELGTVEDIRDLRGLTLNAHDLQELCDVVNKALQLPEDQWPTRPKREVESPTESAITALLTGIIKSCCVDNEIAYGLAASKRSIHELVQHVCRGDSDDNGSVELLRGWRRDAFGELLVNILRGDSSVRIVNPRNAPSLEILEFKS